MSDSLTASPGVVARLTSFKEYLMCTVSNEDVAKHCIRSIYNTGGEKGLQSYLATYESCAGDIGCIRMANATVIEHCHKQGWVDANAEVIMGGAGLKKEAVKPVQRHTHAPRPHEDGYQAPKVESKVESASSSVTGSYDPTQVVYSKSVAVTFSYMPGDASRNKEKGVAIKFANVDLEAGKRNGKDQYGWNKRGFNDSIALNAVEAAALLLVLQGKRECIMPLAYASKADEKGIFHEYGRWKKFYAELGASGAVKVSLSAGGNGGDKVSYFVNINAGDKLAVSAWLGQRLKRFDLFEGLSVVGIIALAGNTLK